MANAAIVALDTQIAAQAFLQSKENQRSVDALMKRLEAQSQTYG